MNLFNSLATTWMYGLFLSCAIMAVLWIIAVRIDRFSIVDPVWTLSLAVLAFFYDFQAHGFERRQAALSIMVALWAWRLSRHLFHRLFKEKGEDARYAKLRVDWKKNLKLNFFAFFQIQAIAAAVLSVPFLIIDANPKPEFEILEWIGIGVWWVGFIGEASADGQLARFKSDPANKGKVCEAGLWNFSRHPNYFFEWTMWVGYFLFALPAPGGIWAICSPVLMFYFLVFGSGIPPAEAQSLKSKGEFYRRYQKSTSVFVPWFKKK